MSVKITLDYDFMDVLSAFPILRKTLRDDLHFNLRDLEEGETMEHYFVKKQALSPEEIRIILRKLNHRVNRFLSKPDVKVYDEPLDIHEEEE